MPDDRWPEGRTMDTPPAVSERAARAQVQAFIADRKLGPGDHLPPERTLCADLGLRRTDLRKALEVLEREGRIWRHVGKGTFLSDNSDQSDQSGFDRLARAVGPTDVMRARRVLETALAREAALNAPATAIRRMRLNAEHARAAGTWREYEALNTDFHRMVAEATGSATLLALFDQLDTLRRMVSSGRTARSGTRPPEDHASFEQHERILAAIAGRDPDAAQTAMRAHLRPVEDRLFGGG